jgi:hypothetical protein
MLKLIYPLLGLALFTQCQPEETELTTTVAKESNELKFGQEVPVQYLEQVTLAGGDVPRRLIVSVENIQDSRCPENTDCITAGSATVVVRASNSQGTNENIQLCLGDCDSEAPQEVDAVTAEVCDVNYRFTLKDVAPYPGLAQEGEVQMARLVVEKI